MESNNTRCDNYILILKSLAANLPILQSWGYIFPRLVRIVVEPGTQARVMDVLRNFSDLPCNESWNSDFHFYVTNTLNKDVISKLKNGLYDRNADNGIIAIVTDNPVADDEQGNYFFVFLEERKYRVDYKIGEIVPYATDLEAIHNKLRSQDNYEMTEEERVLRAAVYFLEPYFFRKGELFRVDEFLELVHQMCIVDENARDTNDMPEIFVKYLFEWQEETNFSNISDLEAEIEVETDYDQTIFYDAENIYITEKMFKKIIEPMRAYVPINSIKKCLRDSGCLIVGNGKSANTYTTKIDVSGAGGSENRIRTMKFKRKLLAVSGGLDFIDVCYFAGIGGKEDA